MIVSRRNRGTEPKYDDPWWVPCAIFAATGLLAVATITIVVWASADDGRTLVQEIGNTLGKIGDLMRRLW